jgi:hypothetical protein
MLPALVATQLGRARADALVDGLIVHPALLQPGDDASRAVIAQALAAVLFDDLLGRVPTAATYAEARWADGERLHLDHAAVRTVVGVTCGELAQGQAGVARILRPLGYAADETDGTWRHLDLPDDIPHYLVGEFHADRLSEPFTAAAGRVVGSSRDPLTGLAQVHLDRLASDGHLPRNPAESLLGELVAAFARHHAPPTLADYETLLAESDEMAWIATEGTTWHHAAVRADADETHPPALVERSFKVGERATETRMVPGSSFELVRRGPASAG